MTLTEFRKLIKGLPGAMDIAIATDDDTIMPICHDSDVVEVQYDDTKEKVFVLVIKPCKCQMENEKLLNDINLN